MGKQGHRKEMTTYEKNSLEKGNYVNVAWQIPLILCLPYFLLKVLKILESVYPRE